MEISWGLFILLPIFTKLLGTHIFDTATFLSNLVEFSQQVPKGTGQEYGQSQGDAASSHNSKPSNNFLRGSHQQIWNQLLALLFILWRILIWIYKVLRDPEKEDVKVLSMFISLFLFEIEHTYTSQTVKASFLSTKLGFPASCAELHPTVRSTGRWPGQTWLFPLTGTGIVQARQWAGN